MAKMALVCAVAVGCISLVQADSQDFKLPITVDSKSQFVDGKSKTSIFKEDVHISQGSLKIDAEEVEVNASQGEGKEVFIARGNPAIYSQTMDDGSDIRAVANEIRYQVSNRTLTLTGDAELHQNSSMVKGNSITFNLDKQQLSAEGQNGEEGRVVTVFRPEAAKKKGEDKK
ncbi:lipopolysaccharide transport periplasmic protein LptA [Paraneptunicella aestuarii]|uniref:lipopolysaccharide transport periplasmic protein LptA n=1 Tax=Paraneptunicella aestuarii TaxID=2831148 RepID=UPI001E632011|nr:lipopolysaccharide transport periplasmic protein LptA [Paraneptunicella aestuarii]